MDEKQGIPAVDGVCGENDASGIHNVNCVSVSGADAAAAAETFIFVDL